MAQRTMICLVDNYDSFTFNVVQSIARTEPDVWVVRNDATSVQAIAASEPEAVIVSPGPGQARDAGITRELFDGLPQELPILGICLGHQALIESCGGTIERDPEPVHGRASLVSHSGHALFEGVDAEFEAGRYHSLRAARPLPASLEEIARTRGGLTMAVAHRELLRFGIQFHPESILTPSGDAILANFVRLARQSFAST